MKKLIKKTAGALLLGAAFTLCACGGKESAAAGESVSPAAVENTVADTAENEKKISVTAVIFPEYDWARELIAGEAGHVELTWLVDNGADLHSYNPSAKDIMTVTGSDVLIYTGGESTGWVDDLLRTAENKDMKVVNLLEVLGDRAKEEELLEGMEEEHEHGREEAHDHEEETEYDEHVWLSLKNAEILCDALTGALCEADPACADIFRKNNEAYRAKLQSLDARYAEAVKAGSRDCLLFGDRFPFRYLAEDYGLTCFAAFPGCSAETEASFETIAFLAGKKDELGLNCVMTLEGTDHRIAETIVKNTAAKTGQILTLDSLQSVTREEVLGGKTYLSAMEENLGVLTKALE